MPAVNIELTPRGPRVTVLEQQIIFFIGPSSSNRLNDMEDYRRRLAEVESHAGRNGSDLVLRKLVARAYGVEDVILKLDIAQGGMRGVSCPNLVVNIVESTVVGGPMLCAISTPENGVACCRALIDLFDADWVDAWWVGTQGNAQITCERGGKAILCGNRGQRELS